MGKQRPAPRKSIIRTRKQQRQDSASGQPGPSTSSVNLDNLVPIAVAPPIPVQLPPNGESEGNHGVGGMVNSNMLLGPVSAAATDISTSPSLVESGPPASAVGQGMPHQWVQPSFPGAYFPQGGLPMPWGVSNQLQGIPGSTGLLNPWGCMPYPGWFNQAPGYAPALGTHIQGPRMPGAPAAFQQSSPPMGPSPWQLAATPLPPVSIPESPAGMQPSANSGVGALDSGSGVSSTSAAPVRQLAQIVQQPPTPFLSVMDRLGMHVPLATKEKIWKGEFVELGAVLDNNRHQPDNEEAFELASSNGLLVLKTKGKDTVKIETIEKWTAAFITFSSILLERHQGKALEILKYMDTIRSIAFRFHGAGWLAYDRQFRLRMAADPSRSWSIVDSELWLICVTSGTKQQTGTPGKGASKPGSSGQQATQGAGKKPCFAFQEGKCTFPKCKFAHVCSGCGKGHPLKNCYANSGFRATQPQSGQAAGRGRGRGTGPPAKGMVGQGTFPGKN